MGLQQVTDEILDEAEEKANEIKSEMESERDEIISEAEEKADGIVSEAEEEIEDEKQALKQKEMSKAKMESKQKIQEAKQGEITKVFEEFREGLEDLNKSEREALVENGKESANFEVGLIKGSEEFEDVVDEEFEEIDQKGIILESNDGSKSVNLTFDRIHQEFRKDHRSEVAQRLFDQ